jgi:hypothetical protein
MSDVLRVSWFERDPGGSTTYVAPVAPSVRLRRHTDGRVAVCTGLSAGSAYPWFVGLPYGRLTDEHVSGPGWSELLVAEQPEPDHHCEGVFHDVDDATIEELEFDALNLLAAIAEHRRCCERERVSQEPEGASS